MPDVVVIVGLVVAVALAWVVLPVALSVSEARRGPLLRFVERSAGRLAALVVSMLLLLALHEGYRGEAMAAFQKAVFAAGVWVAFRAGQRNAARLDSASNEAAPRP